MSLIQYLYQDGKNPCDQEPLKVKINGEMKGEIKKVDGGYSYFDKAKEQQEVFKTITLVQGFLSRTY